MEKSAILVVSFGTTYEEGRKTTVLPTLNRIWERYSDTYDIFEAFTSRMIIKKLKARGIAAETEAEVLDRLLQEGYRQVIVQSLHLVGGQEFNKLKRSLFDVAEKYEGVELSFGRPLLFYMGQEGMPDDYALFLEGAAKDYPVPEDEGRVYVGHGGTSPENAAYSLLQLKALQTEGHTNTRIATLECYPELEDTVIPWQFGVAPKTVHLLPLLFVAGEHMANDIFGEEDSVKQQLLAAGYEVIDHRETLGAKPFAQDLFLAHLEDAIQHRYVFKYDKK